MKKPIIRDINKMRKHGGEETPGLYDLVRYSIEKNVSLKKAATDYEIDGNLKATNAMNLFDTVRKEGNVLSEISVLDSPGLIGDLNQFVNAGILVGRNAAADARAATFAGTDISGTTKNNIGNKYELQEFYHVFSRTAKELVNVGQYGRKKFDQEIVSQLNIGLGNKLETLLWTGDGTNDHSVNQQPVGLIKRCTDSITAAVTDRTVSTANFNAVTSWIAKLDLLIDAQKLKYADESVFYINTRDHRKYTAEMKATGNFTGGKDNTKRTLIPYEGYSFVISPFIPEGTILFMPKNNIKMIVSTSEGVERSVIKDQLPKTLTYSLYFWLQFQFVADSKVVYGADLG